MNPEAHGPAAARLNQVTDACPAAISAAKAKLRAAYRSAGREPPANLAAGFDAQTSKTLGWLVYG